MGDGVGGGFSTVGEAGLVEDVGDVVGGGLGAVTSASAISRLVLPAATSASTSSSRGLRPAAAGGDALDGRGSSGLEVVPALVEEVADELGDVETVLGERDHHDVAPQLHNAGVRKGRRDGPADGGGVRSTPGRIRTSTGASTSGRSAVTSTVGRSCM